MTISSIFWTKLPSSRQVHIPGSLLQRPHPEYPPPPPVLIPILDSTYTTDGVTYLSSKSSRITNKVLEVLAVTIPTTSLLRGLGSSSGPKYSDAPGISEHANKLVPCPLPCNLGQINKLPLNADPQGPPLVPVCLRRKPLQSTPMCCVIEDLNSIHIGWKRLTSLQRATHHI